MAQQKTIAEIITIAKISISLAGNKVGRDFSFFGQSPDSFIHVKIYMELMSLEFLYANFPSEDYTRSVANYVYALCFPYNKEAEVILANLGGSAPVVSGPSNSTVAEGETASFTIAVTSATPYTVQWYRDGVLIVGATSNTYSFTAAIGDDDAVFFAIATNPSGSTSSTNGTLTVTTEVTGSYYIGDTDYFAALNGGTDNITYLGTFDITDGQPLSITISDALLANNKYHVYKYPIAQGVKTTWFNTSLNFGQVPDFVFRSTVTIGGFYYLISRNAMSFDVTSPMVFS